MYICGEKLVNSCCIFSNMCLCAVLKKKTKKIKRHSFSCPKLDYASGIVKEPDTPLILDPIYFSFHIIIILY